MKKYNYIAITFAFLSLTGCGDGIDLPSLGVETDLNKIILPDNNINLIQVELKDNSVPMEKVGIHSEEDFARIREKKDVEEPWITGYQMLKESSFSQKNRHISGCVYCTWSCGNYRWGNGRGKLYQCSTWSVNSLPAGIALEDRK